MRETHAMGYLYKFDPNKIRSVTNARHLRSVQETSVSPVSVSRARNTRPRALASRPTPFTHIMTITIETGEAEAAKFHAAFAAGFAANNHAETLAGMLAEKVDVEWSDGFVGEKTPSEIFEQFGKSWGFMVSNFLWSPDTIVDTSNDKIIMYGRLIINIDGKLGSPNLIDNKLSFVLKYDSAGKICQWTGYWDNTYAPMLEALGKVSAALEAAK